MNLVAEIQKLFSQVGSVLDSDTVLGFFVCDIVVTALVFQSRGMLYDAVLL